MVPVSARDAQDKPKAAKPQPNIQPTSNAHGNPFDWNLKEVSEALGPLLHKVCRSSESSSKQC